MTRTVVFLGPTVGPEFFCAQDGTEVRPPIGQGDVFRAVRDGAERIAIVDGYFNSTPSVTHKEIIWAIDQGINVFGASSMGALRAAELGSFGMIGIGWVFEAFASGALEDDDEVAIIHAPARLGYASVSEAMVNIRRTLDRAVEQQQVSAEAAAALIGIAKRTYYADRDWPRLLEEARPVIAGSTLARFKAWLPKGRVDIKREDALALATTLRDPSTRQPPRQPRYEHTALVETVRQAAVGANPLSFQQDDGGELIAHWRKYEPATFVYELLALIDALTFEREQHAPSTADDVDILQAADAWRDMLGLAEEGSVNAWLAARGISDAQVISLLARDVRLLRARDMLRPLADRCLVDRLSFHANPLIGERGAISSGTSGSTLDWYRPGIDLAAKVNRGPVD